jgi:ribosomal protein L21E
MKAKVLASGLLLIATLALSAISVFAQDMKYKVGDRVEIDTMKSSDPRNAKYKTGTIVAIDDARPYDKAYIVTLDESPAQKFRYIVRDYTTHWIRDMQGGDAGAKPEAKPDAKPDVPELPINAKPDRANQPTPANDQPEGQKYKVGDRVEVDIIEAETPAMAQWKKGTITEVNTGVSSRAYTVRVDPVPGQLPDTEHVPFRDEDRWLRPLGGAAPNIETDKLRVDENNTVLADRELLDCKNLKRGPARNGQRPPVELIKRIIQCTVERPSEVGSDGARTMDIIELLPGVPHSWMERVDSSIDATADTMVYPYHVKWDQKNFYRTYNQIQTGNERNMSCYVTGNEWFCGTTAGGNKEGVNKRVPVEK